MSYSLFSSADINVRTKELKHFRNRSSCLVLQSFSWGLLYLSLLNAFDSKNVFGASSAFFVWGHKNNLIEFTELLPGGPWVIR